MADNFYLLNCFVSLVMTKNKNRPAGGLNIKQIVHCADCAGLTWRSVQDVHEPC